MDFDTSEKENLFKHSINYDEGINTRKERIGNVEVLVTQDDTGDYDNLDDALKNLPAGGGIINVKHGTYAGTTITKSNIVIKGAGWNTHIATITATNKNNIILEKFDCTEQIVFTNCEHCKISEIRLIDTIDASIVMNSCNYCIVENNTGITGQMKDAFIFLNSCTYCSIIKNKSTTGEGQINAESSNWCTINENILYWSGDGTIHLLGCSNNVVVGNSVLGGTTYGIWLESTNNYNIVSNNRITNSVNGVYIEAVSTKNIITSNNCVGCTNAITDLGTSTSTNNNIN